MGLAFADHCHDGGELCPDNRVKLRMMNLYKLPWESQFETLAMNTGERGTPRWHHASPPAFTAKV